MLLINSEQVAGRSDIERVSGFTIDESNIASRFRVNLRSATAPAPRRSRVPALNNMLNARETSPNVRKSDSTTATPRPRCNRSIDSIADSTGKSPPGSRPSRNSNSCRMFWRPDFGGMNEGFEPLMIKRIRADAFDIHQAHHTEGGRKLSRSFEFVLQSSLMSTHQSAARHAFLLRAETA